MLLALLMSIFLLAAHFGTAKVTSFINVNFVREKDILEHELITQQFFREKDISNFSTFFKYLKKFLSMKGLVNEKKKNKCNFRTFIKPIK
jgi:hypothetical protein